MSANVLQNNFVRFTYVFSCVAERRGREVQKQSTDASSVFLVVNPPATGVSGGANIRMGSTS